MRMPVSQVVSLEADKSRRTSVTSKRRTSVTDNNPRRKSVTDSNARRTSVTDKHTRRTSVTDSKGEDRDSEEVDEAVVHRHHVPPIIEKTDFEYIADPDRRRMRLEEKLVNVETTYMHGLYTKLRNGHDLGVYSASWASDGRHLASCSHDGSVIVWDVDNMDPKRRYEGHRGPVYDVAFCPRNGHDILASCSADASCRIWNKKSGVQLFSIREPNTAPLYSLAFSRDGSLLALGSASGSVNVYNIDHLRSLAFHPDTVSRDLLVMRVGVAVSSDDDESDDVGNMSSSSSSLSSRGKPIRAVAWSQHDDVLFSAGDDKIIRGWTIADGGVLSFEYEEHTEPVLDIAISPGDGDRLLSASSDGTAKIWHWKNHDDSSVTLSGHVGVVYSCCWSPELEGRRCFTGGHDLSVKVWDSGTGLLLQNMAGIHRSWVLGLAARPDGLAFASASGDRTVGVFRSLPVNWLTIHGNSHMAALVGALKHAGVELMRCFGGGPVIDDDQSKGKKLKHQQRRLSAAEVVRRSSITESTQGGGKGGGGGAFIKSKRRTSMETSDQTGSSKASVAPASKKTATVAPLPERRSSSTKGDTIGEGGGVGGIVRQESMSSRQESIKGRRSSIQQQLATEKAVTKYTGSDPAIALAAKLAEEARKDRLVNEVLAAKTVFKAKDKLKNISKRDK